MRTTLLTLSRITHITHLLRTSIYVFFGAFRHQSWTIPIAPLLFVAYICLYRIILCIFVLWYDVPIEWGIIAATFLVQPNWFILPEMLCHKYVWNIFPCSVVNRQHQRRQCCIATTFCFAWVYFYTSCMSMYWSRLPGNPMWKAIRYHCHMYFLPGGTPIYKPYRYVPSQRV